jgi:hypothetical protein
VADPPSHTSTFWGWEVITVLGLIVTVVEQLELFPQASTTVHVIVDGPKLYVPLALFPDPLRVVAPDMVYVVFSVPVQLSVAVRAGIV